MHPLSHATTPEIRLVPVVEMEPWKYAGPDLASSAGLGIVEDWPQYWMDCLAQSGIVGLEPITPDSFHVPICRLTDEHGLEQIFLNHCRSTDDDGNAEYDFDPDNQIAFSGGHVLYIGEEAIFTPNCCGDLGNLEDWYAAATHRDSNKAGLWIGHPSLEVRFDGTHLLLSGANLVP